MNKENLFQKINPKIFLIAATLLVIIVVTFLLSLLSGVKPTEETIGPTPVPQQIPAETILPTPAIKVSQNALINSYGNVTFTLLPVTFPSALNVYTYSPAVINETEAQTIAKRLGIDSPVQKESTQNGDVLVFTQDANQVIFYTGAGNIQYFTPIPAGDRTIQTKKQVENIAAAYIQKFSPFAKGLEVNSDGVIYNQGSGDEVRVDSLDEASSYDVPFEQRINNIPIYNQYGSYATAHVAIAQNSVPFKVILNTPVNFSSYKKANLTTLNQAKKQVEEGFGIIAQYGQDVEAANLPTPISTNFTRVKLAYFRDFASKIMYPIYVFEGTATASSGDYPIVIYLPAVSK